MGNKLTGAGKVRLDDRGRVAVPKQFRDVLRAPSVITGHPHGCLAIYTMPRFNEIKTKLETLRNAAGYFDSLLEEMVIGAAEQLQLDSADRFLIGGYLRDTAGIRRDALIFCLSDSVRVWGEERWKQRRELLNARLQDKDLSPVWKDVQL